MLKVSNMSGNLEVKLYRKRFEHGMKEHKYERRATYFLLIMLFVMAIGIIFRTEIISFYILLPLVLIATIMRLLAWYHHNQEKKLYKILNNKPK